MSSSPPAVDGWPMPPVPDHDGRDAAIAGRSRRAHAPRGGVRPLIVVFFDGSEGAARAIAAATTLMPGAEVLAVCGYHSVRAAAGAALLGASAAMVRGGALSLDAQRRAEAEQTSERGAALAAAGGCPSSALALAATGAVWAAIDHLAEQQQAAALVVGARGRSGLSRLVLGSVSAGLIHHATRPVLVVPGTHPARRPDGQAPGRTRVLDR